MTGSGSFGNSDSFGNSGSFDSTAAPPENKPLSFAMLGMVEGNGHPYSWSAILNGYDPQEMRQCPFPTIPDYLSRQPERAFGIGNAKVTHVWTEHPEQARHIAKAARIPHVVGHPLDVLGKVDAVIIPTDKGSEHVERCRPFVEAGLPVFVDKPLVDREADLAVFARWVEQGAPIMSSSSMRYSKEYAPHRLRLNNAPHRPRLDNAPHRLPLDNFGGVKLITMTMMKKWETYGIHALEAVYPLTGPGFVSARNIGAGDTHIVHYRHQAGADVIAYVSSDIKASSNILTVYGAAEHVQSVSSDAFFSFKAQLADFVQFVRTGVRPYPFAETIELMKMLIAGIRSRERGGAEVPLDDIRV